MPGSVACILKEKLKLSVIIFEPLHIHHWHVPLKVFSAIFWFNGTGKDGAMKSVFAQSQDNPFGNYSESYTHNSIEQKSPKSHKSKGRKRY